MKEEKLLYDINTLSERIEDLRKGDGRKKCTLTTLSNNIKKKTGVSISHTQLGKYENPDLIEKPNINYLLAIASYYNVSIDYLLGKTNSKSKNYTDQMASNKFGLSDLSMKKLSYLCNNLNDENSFKLHLINRIIENDNFITELSQNLITFYKANDNKMNTNDKLKKDYGVSVLDISKYNLTKTFEHFIENMYKEDSIKTKKQYLFDIRF